MSAPKPNPYAPLVAPLLDWYARGHRDLPWRRDTEPYHVWISEIMLQQTRVEAVKSYYARFLAALPTLADLAAVPEDKLLKLWEGLGYYNRARNLKRAANQILTEHSGLFPKTSEELAKIVGVGPYTAGAIASICFGERTPAVDGNVLRVLARYTADNGDIAAPATKKRVTETLRAVYPEQAGDFTQAIMELGATVCLPNGAPNCAACPLAKTCAAFTTKTTTDYPVKSRAKARKIVKKTVFLCEKDGKLAIIRRPNKGLLAGLWEFPNTDMEPDTEAAIAHAEALGFAPIAVCRTVSRTHIFTHVEWQMFGIYLSCAAEPKGFTFATPEALADTFALPTAFRIFLD